MNLVHICFITCLWSVFVADIHCAAWPRQSKTTTTIDTDYAAICVIVKVSHVEVYSMLRVPNMLYHQNSSPPTQDQNDDLREWVEHHLLMGFGRIYLYDNGSARPISTVLSDYIDKGVVIVTHVEGAAKQVWVFNECIRLYAPR